ncbi:MAG TPA: hypothetical protein ENK16_08700, partial [Chromatiales bacterium]|nr:hypothetical protein [Chromatiales bacterium]
MHDIGSLTARAGLALVYGLMLLFASASAQQAPAHQHGGAVVPMDAEGKRLESYEIRHKMDQATIDALRAKIPLYRGMTDMEMMMNMAGMDPNYEWYASDLSMRGDIGVLILSHGVGENSDRMMKAALEPVSRRWPTAIGFGMAMTQSSHLQSAVDDLVAHGAKTIVLVPSGVITKYNSLTRQWKYIFDLDGQEATYLEVPKVKSAARFVMTRHLADSELVTEILYDHVREVSQNPANEVVIIVGHGPEDIEDNKKDLAIVQVHVKRLKVKNEFADVKLINLQDDAIPPVRESNV